MATLIYKLTFGNYINYADNSQPAQLQLEQGVNSEFSDGTKTYNILLCGVKVNRKIYQPTEIEAELDIMQSITAASNTVSPKAPKVSDVTNLLVQRQVKLEILETEHPSAKVGISAYKNVYTIAQNCYVYEAFPQLKRDSNGLKMYVKLSIFSMDKLMTLNKYSKAYVARRFGSQILKSESLQFGEFSEGVPLIETDVEGQQHLKYTDEGKRLEFIQPYLVQYNETFYDFLVRTSNRCGEFLYFEDGKLILGLPDSRKPVDVSGYESVTAQQRSKDPLEITAYARDSVKDGDGAVGKLNQSVLMEKSEVSNGTNDGKSVCPYPKNVFPDHTSSNAEYASDDYIFPLFKDKFTNWEREMYYDGSASDTAMSLLLPFFASVLTNESDGAKGILGSLAKAAAGGEALMMAKAYMQVSSVNKASNEAYIEPYKDKPEQYKDDKVVQFAAVLEKSWTTLKYYNDIYKYEEAQQRQIVCINMGTSFIDVKLGQKITIEGMEGTYVIIQIKQLSEEAWSHDYDHYGADDASDKYTGERSLKIYAIPASPETNKFYPPVLPVPMIRRSGPQTAYVAANVEPKYQGRVRIAFPWQSLGGPEREDLAKAGSKLKAVEVEIQTLEDEKKALLVRLTKLKDILIPELKTYVMATVSDRKQLLMSRRKKLKVLENELKKPVEEKKETATEEDIKSKQNEIDQLKAEIESFERAAKEHDAKNAKGKGEKDLEKDNSVICSYKTECDNASLLYKKAGSDLNQAETEKEKLEEQCEKLVKIVDDSVKAMATPWVRVVSPMATAGGGTYFRPRVGDEVMVNFENGNVERPYVMGSLYSKNVLTPDEGLYRKKAPEMQWKDISMSMMSPNGHHITFTDPSTGGNFFLNMISPGLGFYGSTFGFNKFAPEAKDLAGGIHIGDRYGIYSIEMKSHKRAIDIKSPFGTVSIDAFAGITINAPNGDISIKGQNVSIEAGNKLTLLSGKNVKSKEPSLSMKSADGLKSMGVGIAGEVAGAVTDTLLTPVVDLSLVRKVVETFVRPVDGTTLIKSKRYLMMEAGSGKATISSDRYATALGKSKATQEKFFIAMINCVNFISNRIEDVANQYGKLFENGKEKSLLYQVGTIGVLKDPQKPNVLQMAWEADKKQEVSRWLDDNFTDNKFSEFYDNTNQIGWDEKKTKEQREKFLKNARGLAEIAFNIYKVYQNANHMFDSQEKLDVGDFNWLKECITNGFDQMREKKVFGFFYSEGSSWGGSNPDECAHDSFLDLNSDLAPAQFGKGEVRTRFKRLMMLFFLHQVYQHASNKSEKYLSIGFDVDKEAKGDNWRNPNIYYWRELILKMDRHHKLQNNLARTLWDNTLMKVWNKFKSNVPSFVSDKKTWADTPDGQILFSDQDDKTLNFDNEGHLEKKTSANVGTLDHLKKVLIGIK
ncbi:MAG: hypothetical protein IJ618_03505 [Prevotella sp.]|nr:hypothetical protein [Prevotella sp.]